MDPKEMGIQPTEVGNPTKKRHYCTCKETTYTQSAKNKEIFKFQTRGMNRGEYLPRGFHLGHQMDTLYPTKPT